MHFVREKTIVDVKRVSQGLVNCGESRKTRQEIDFSKVLDHKQTTAKGRSQEMQAARSSRVSASEAPAKQEPGLVSLGKVTRHNPNVSSLLVKHPVYGKDCWRILHGRINRDKPYTRIRPGTEIFMDPKTREVVWGKMRPAPEASKALARAAGQPPPSPDPGGSTPGTNFSERLVGAVKPFFGTPYGEVNCYELLVKGLTNLGVRYQGAGGLGRKLMVMAKEQGLPRYAYFNGEGLIRASGSPVYSKTHLQVRSPERQANQLLKEIEPYLEKGQILSFSIHSRGHTGIVSRSKDTWTLINSGELNHSLGSTRQRRGVGEESLAAEVRDWFELAKARRESLRITLGRLNEQKLLTYYDAPPEKPQKA
jgi:hypothetical protein